MIRGLMRSLLTTVAAVAATTLVCQAEPQPLLTRHLRAVTLSGEAPFVGRLPAAQNLKIDVVLALRDAAGLESFLRKIYDPASALYRQFLTVEQFSEKFGPTQQDFDTLSRFAKANGFSVRGGSRDAMDLQLEGSVAAIEAAFHVQMGIYHDAIENRDFYAPDREPTVELPFQLWHISGLDNYTVPRPALVRRPPGVKPAATTGSCPNKAFCGSDMRTAYYEEAVLTGKGQNIGLLEYFGFDIADLNTYYKNTHQKRTAAVKGISTDGTSLKCLFSEGCDDTEQTIDMTQALGMAPGITTLYVYVGSTDTALLGSMSSHKPLPLNLSSSWGWFPADPSVDDPYFMRMAAQGQSFFTAAGDSGEWTPYNDAWEADSAYVISVGGTDLTTKGPAGPWASETVWTPYGGGGISPDGILVPSWQSIKGVITKANKGSKIYRNGPDVSANANFTFYVCADQQACTSNLYGGTSFAAPMWAGYLALANEQAASKGDKPPGFINPTIYRLGLGSDYNFEFHDITVGNNGFPATKGYDLASGWGSPSNDGLIDALAP